MGGTSKDERKPGALDAVACAIGIFALLASYRRLSYGVDFIDEAWYVSLLHQCHLGARLFIDEFRPQQISAWFFLPFYKLWAGGSPDASGCVYFVRQLYFAMVLMASACAFRFLSTFVRRWLAFPIAALCLLDVFYIPSISYNTVGRWTLASGIFLLAAEVRAPSGRRAWPIAAGALLATASLAYPPLAIAAIAAIIGLYSTAKSEPAARSARFAAGALIASGLLFALTVLMPRLDEVATSLAINSQLGLHRFSLEKLLEVLDGITDFFKYPCIGAFLYVVTSRRVAPRSRGPLLAAIFLASMFWVEVTRADVIAPCTAVVAFWSVAAIAFRKDRESLPLLASVIGAFLVAGLATAFSSANGYPNFAVGASPLAVVTVLLLVLGLDGSRLGRVAAVALVACLAALYARNSYQEVYGQGPVLGPIQHVPSAFLEARVEEGPYRGLRTIGQRKEVADALARDFRNPAITGRKTILSYFDFPAAVLYSGLRSDSYSTWPMRKGFFESNEIHSKRRDLEPEEKDLPDVVFRWKPSSDFASNYDPSPMNDPVAPVFFTPAKGYSVLVDNAVYTILLRNRK